MFRVKVVTRTVNRHNAILWLQQRALTSTLYKCYCLSAESSTDAKDQQFNIVGIQMLPKFLRREIFRNSEKECVDEQVKKEIEKHLAQHNLLGLKTFARQADEFTLPPLYGQDIDEHFRIIAEKQIKNYKNFADNLASKSLPARPKHWIFKPGWTKYDSVSKTCYAVDFPRENALVFDVEVLMSEGDYPTMATAVSPTSWYSWCSKRLIGQSQCAKTQITTDDLIPFQAKSSQGSDYPQLVIGHNVGFDRSFIREQYMIQNRGTRFLDTMSLHIAVSGLTGLQRVLFMANKTGSKRKEVKEHEHETARHGYYPSFEWTEESSLNNLNDVYQLYCKNALPLPKHMRDVFINGTADDVRENFQDLMTYCATDVTATHDIFKCIWQEYWLRFPHPVTFAGMLEMGLTYLPVNENWERYIDSSKTKYNDLESELNSVLFELAEKAVKLKKESYSKNVWLWDLDWTPRKMRITQGHKATADEDQSETKQSSKNKKNSSAQPKAMIVSSPRWYADLCNREVTLLPSKISLQRRISAKLLQLVWDGFPLHFDDNHGWGYLVPLIDSSSVVCDQDQESSIDSASATYPFYSLLKLCSETRPDWSAQLASVSDQEKLAEDLLEKIQNQNGSDCEDVSSYWDELKRINKPNQKKASKPIEFSGEGPFLNVVHGCEFYKLPHKDGTGNRVGNPLAKDFIPKIEQGVLRSTIDDKARSILKFGETCSYWKNNVKRISSQMVVQLNDSDVPDTVSSNDRYKVGSFHGAIVPRVITAGTVTRRAVEPTWLTASNAYRDRIGSELKAMIQSPPGYHFVGADVDSQELWIAAILGDANFHNVHGCTAFGWMTLQGTKAEGTDLHSRIANLVDINRDQAKVFNYGRIYGAGQRFAEQLLLKFNHRLTQAEAHKKARTLFLATKGRRTRIRKNTRGDREEDEDENLHTEWRDGSESQMFNKLESIARSPEPRTPVLNCLISRALEPRNVKSEFMTSRINWVVQSSAVDYLHLMLVCMRWLFDLYDIDGRFCISIHDEVRYLVASNDRYRAALALHITNLLTRSMFSHKLGFKDLPMSVAFFSSVEIDTCLRKEPSADCVTPSNPLGLKDGYGVPPGESIDISETLHRTSGTLEDQKSDKISYRKLC